MTTVRAVISLAVSVPVLSEQIVVTEPRVSIEVMVRVMALRFAIAETPRASVIVRIAGRPSGIAPTAKPMEAWNSSSRSEPWSSQPSPNRAAAANTMMRLSTLPNEFICLVSGVSRVSTSLSMSLIRPISVSWPVATTTQRPEPPATIEEENAIERRSPTPAPASTASVDFSAASDSPVSADSSMRKLLDCTRRRSAGTRSPLRSRTMSPGTISSASTSVHDPSRRTVALGESMSRMPSSAFSARPPCTKPMTALITATAAMTMVSTQ